MSRVSRPVVRSAKAEDVDVLMADIRQADWDEIYATTGNDPRWSIEDGVATSVPVLTATVDGELLCIFGISPVSILTRHGVPWLVGTNLMNSHQFVFLRENRRYMRHLLELYGSLVNYVDDRHEASKRWLRWLGFELGQPEPYGHFGLPFRRFYMDTNKQRQGQVNV
jgi:hypothetical protein